MATKPKDAPLVLDVACRVLVLQLAALDDDVIMAGLQNEPAYWGAYWRGMNDLTREARRLRNLLDARKDGEDGPRI